MYSPVNLTLAVPFALEIVSALKETSAQTLAVVPLAVEQKTPKVALPTLPAILFVMSASIYSVRPIPNVPIGNIVPLKVGVEMGVEKVVAPRV